MILDFKIVEDKIKDIEADLEIVFIVEKNFSYKWVEDEELLKSLGFKGESEEVCLLAEKRKLYVGLDSFDKDEVRLAISKALNAIKKTEFKTIKIGSYVDVCPVSYIKGLVEGAILGTYEFNKYKSKKEERSKRLLSSHLKMQERYLLI